MRNLKRIPRIIRKLEKAWMKSPDQRLGQFISNLIGPGPHDVFFIEDDDWEKFIDIYGDNK
jgi:hypothetical protein